MGALQTVEKQVGDLFKGLPPLPKKSKESLANAFPWIALIFGIVQLMAAYGLWHLARTVERFNDIANTYSAYFTGESVGLSATDRAIIYIGIALLVVDAVILLMAYPHLKTRSRRGWDLLFLGAVINVVYAVVTLFVSGQHAGDFIFSLLGSAVGFYLLFQVRELYKGDAS